MTVTDEAPNPGRNLCALSVDLDPLSAYYQIHGLGEPPRQVLNTILRKALPRFVDLFAQLEVPATFFVVGSDLAQSREACELLQHLAEAGHEIGNHTFSHPYALNNLPPELIGEEIARAHQTIAKEIGEAHAPVGFRAPGYFIGSHAIAALVEQGYRYDSSMFPSPPYYLAKAAVMAGLAVRGRRSGAVLADIRGLAAPADPYRPDPARPWRRGAAPLIELPVAVLPRTRLPVIGTALAVSPPGMRRHLLNGMRERPFFNLELHGIDLADAIEDRIPTELAGRQPDLRVAFDEKRAILRGCIENLKRDFEFITLERAAEIFAERL
jgi:hypothetical protein